MKNETLKISNKNVHAGIMLHEKRNHVFTHLFFAFKKGSYATQVTIHDLQKKLFLYNVFLKMQSARCLS